MFKILMFERKFMTNEEFLKFRVFKKFHYLELFKIKSFDF